MDKLPVLLVEDAADVQELVRSLLTDEQVIVAHTLKQAREELQKNRFDMILLDIMLPDGSGFDLCSRAELTRQSHDAAVVFLTAKADTSDKVYGFGLGADDYITKPVDPIEFRARITAKLSKIRAKRAEAAVDLNRLTFGDLEVDILAQRANLIDPLSGETRSRLGLTQLEFKLLVYFARHEGRTVSRSELLQELWGNTVHVFDRTVDTHISHLRKKLTGSTYTIRSVYGSGYKLAKSKVQSAAS